MNATRMTRKFLTTQGRFVSTLLLAFALGTSACAGVSAQARTATPASPTSPVQPENGETAGHVFLCSSSGPVDVTSTLSTVNNQTYAALNGQSIAIVLDNATGKVFNLNGNVIGYIAQPTP